MHQAVNILLALVIILLLTGCGRTYFKDPQVVVKSVEVSFKCKEPRYRYINNIRTEGFWYVYEDATGEPYYLENFEGEKFRLYYLSKN